MDFLQQLQFFGQIVFAAFLGGFTGLEREIHNKPAGLRTHMLIAATSCALIGIGDVLISGFESQHSLQILAADPTRVIQAIVIGIGFVGGGTIIKDVQSGEVKNLTTAASILFTATLGMAVALTMYYLALSITILNLIITIGMYRFERWFKKY